MLKKYQEFNFAFFTLFLIQLIGVVDPEILKHIFSISNVHYYTKPLITLSLFGLLLFKTGLRGRFSKRIGIGLIFGLIGDVFLQFNELNELFFVSGLIAFLIGHLFYISAFYVDYRLNKTVYQKQTNNAIIAYSFFSVLFCAALWTHLGAMKIPVIAYALVISIMGVMAVNRFGRVNTLSFRLIFIGSLLFVLSDSLLAIDRFLYSFRLFDVIVIATYMTAQYLITIGNLERKIKNKIEDI